MATAISRRPYAGATHGLTRPWASRMPLAVPAAAALPTAAALVTPCALTVTCGLLVIVVGTMVHGGRPVFWILEGETLPDRCRATRCSACQ